MSDWTIASVRRVSAKSSKRPGALRPQFAPLKSWSTRDGAPGLWSCVGPAKANAVSNVQLPKPNCRQVGAFFA